MQVKTTTRYRERRWEVMTCTRGGNRSWNGTVKWFSPSRCDRLFVLVGDGRRWYIPADAVDGRSGLALGGPKYAEFEVEPGRPLPSSDRARSLCSIAPGGVPERSKGRDCKSRGSAFAGSNPAPAMRAERPSAAEDAADGGRVSGVRRAQGRWSRSASSAASGVLTVTRWRGPWPCTAKDSPGTPRRTTKAWSRRIVRAT